MEYVAGPLGANHWSGINFGRSFVMNTTRRPCLGRIWGSWMMGALLVASIAIPACDEPASDTAGTGGAGAVPASGAGGNPGLTSAKDGLDMQACESCAKPSCSTEMTKCKSTTGCEAMVRCLALCKTGDTTCSNKCTGTDATAAAAAVVFAACALTACPAQCSASTATGTGGTGGKGSSGTKPGAGTGGTTSRGAGGTTAAGGTTNALGLYSGVNWLTIADGWADPGEAPNGALKVSGALYAFGDECSTLEWTPTGMGGCISGRMCPPDNAGANWGVGIGFDLSNTGDAGTPPNTKMPWDATAVNATGFAWIIQGQAPGLGVWVTNMAPKFGGQCSAADCAIAGPADGVLAPALNGRLNFVGMYKDDWGGGGIAYNFESVEYFGAPIQAQCARSQSDVLGLRLLRAKDRGCRALSASSWPRQGHARTPCASLPEGSLRGVLRRDSEERMPKHTLKDGTEAFEVTLLEAREPTRVVLFAVGGGGNPELHLPLLTHLAESGCTVIAPHFDRLLAPVPTENELLLRGRRLKLALDTWVPQDRPVVGIGHSIGATMLIALAGGQVWMRSGRRLDVATDARLCKLALLTPATGFFRAPSALDAVNVPMLIWAGTEDTITPREHADYLQRTLGSRLPIDVRVVEGAGHFSFMNTPPPNTTEPLPNREAFLDELAKEILRYVTDITYCYT
ncbi:MAG: hypothetical protein QM784_22960 [Polyangiaceae bacterium]